MKLNKSFLLIPAAVVIAGAVGVFVLTKEPSREGDVKAASTVNIPSESTVTVPEPDALDIETLATYNIPTYAAAGSQSHAIYTSYSDTEVKGYLTYEAAPDNPASFIVVKDENGQWKLDSYEVLGETDL